eukprot:CAMPEP_0171100988 /NCGR_PEP_ID=MMETSP0766_2-20121228/53655_1 /TAXON_ID=439317 /ORGANISM="Gambierdiscus australes, Strain CAWD 149" /LENGTH=158 /DNA_ID=CAMNT_0011560925 /DNA_START=56 /DNA_END=532 /DNA_ORIENTATION=+
MASSAAACELEESSPLAEEDSEPAAAVARWSRRALATAALAVLFVAAALLRGAERGGAPMVPKGATSHLIMASHFSQTCSFKCNKKFWAKNEFVDYRDCCEKCPGRKCYFPCSETCSQQLHMGLEACEKGDAACKKPVQERHAKCCLDCPGEMCVTEE